MLRKSLVIITGLLSLFGCKSGSESSVLLEEVTVTEYVNERPPYNPSRTKRIDITHTKLDLRLNWDEQSVIGTAWITFNPYYYTTQIIELDAKKMDIRSVSREMGGVSIPLEYVYDGRYLAIDLARPFKRTESTEITIEYVAHPNKAESPNDKGLYFINADRQDKYKPQQIWTQGETESNSHWFPCFDSPNERMTTEIFLHVDSNFTTLSNGTLEYSLIEENGMRMDYWVMNEPHAPYLVMLGIGEFAVVEDSWGEISVNYYVEEDQKEYARKLWGHSPAMIEFFSNKLGVPYPWPSYNQMVARDYISGAMENTTAVIYSTRVYGDFRELIDDPQDDIIAHELFHQWFGDYVTCESWANLPLNESFAVYGEYLWREHRDGRDAADSYFDRELRSYLRESNSGRNKNLIRHDYGSPGEMFDAHSYAKGGRILHMLRYYLGDKAFFDGLQMYLEEHAHSAAEIHDLRLIYEELTGEDLNWFFNQWFLDKGHPILDVKYDWIDSTFTAVMTVRQEQSEDAAPLYKLPIVVEMYLGSTSFKEYVQIEKREERFEFPLPEKPLAINFDAEKILVCEKTDYHTDEEWMTLFVRGKRYMDRREAFDALIVSEDSILRSQLIIAALHDKNYRIILSAIPHIDQLDGPLYEEVRELVFSYSHDHENPRVREAALKASHEEFENNEIGFYQHSLNDSSYKVASAALLIVHELDEVTASHEMERIGYEVGGALKYTMSGLRAKNGATEDMSFFVDLLGSAYSSDKSKYLGVFATYLMSGTDEVLVDGSAPIFEMAEKGHTWRLRYYAMQNLEKLLLEMNERSKKSDGYYKEQWDAAIANHEKRMNDIKESETSENLRTRYGLSN